jgi:hypothetical protein
LKKGVPLLACSAGDPNLTTSDFFNGLLVASAGHEKRVLAGQNWQKPRKIAARRQNSAKFQQFSAFFGLLFSANSL